MDWSVNNNAVCISWEANKLASSIIIIIIIVAIRQV
jgi:hypothetical protein